MLIHGTQLEPNSVDADRLVAAFLANILLADGTIPLTAALNFNNQRGINVGAPIGPNDIARLSDVQAIKWKDSVLVATTGNITLSGLQTIDGIAVAAGKRVLVRAQTNAAENGIYIASSGAWSRSADANTAQLLQSLMVSVEKGSTYGDHRFAQNSDDIDLGTTPIVFADSGVGVPVAFPTTANKHMACQATSADGQLACSTPILYTPSGDGYVEIKINGAEQWLGNDKNADCFFSGDNGATARTIANISAGDLLYWNQSIAKFALKTTFFLSMNYAV